jgi:hypothetical protein
MSAFAPLLGAKRTVLIKGIERAGRFVVGVKPDGTMIIGDKPVDTASFVPQDAQPSPPPVRRFGEKLNGGQSEA